MSARFEVVRSDAAQPWHARFVSNGRIVWTTEQYTRKVSAERAMATLVRVLTQAGLVAETRYIDKRAS